METLAKSSVIPAAGCSGSHLGIPINIKNTKFVNKNKNKNKNKKL
jgi:hypothetical protein